VRLDNGYLETTDGGSPQSCSITVEVRGVAASTRNLVNDTGPLSYGYSEGDYEVPGAQGTLRVIADAPKITSPVPPNGVVGASYSHQVTVTGSPTIAVSVTGLPPGLTFSPSTRKITGFATTPGSFSGSITATNGIAPDAKQNFTIVIKAPPLVITTETLPPISGGSRSPPKVACRRTRSTSPRAACRRASTSRRKVSCRVRRRRRGRIRSPCR
jgi:hypothetical protein